MTRVPSLWAQFQDLKPSEETGAVEAIRCGADNQHLLVCGAHSEPVLLLSTEPRVSLRSDIRLKHVGVQFDRKFEIANGDSGACEIGNFCKFFCDPSSPHLHQYFVELMVASANAHSGVLSDGMTDDVVNALLELFRKLSLPTDRSITGLWGELLLIHLAASPGTFIDAWHLRETDGFDFAFSDGRIEVKATERPTREHEFSLAQVRSERPNDVVASVTLSRSSAGLSTLDLARLIAERLTSTQQGKLWSLVLETLGDDAEADVEQRFDVKNASDALTFVRATDIPAPEISASAAPFVTDVRFRSNINALCASSALEKARILSRSTP